MQIVSWMVPFVFVVLGEATMTGRSTKQLSDLRRAWILHPALVYAITWGIVLIMVLASMATFMSEASPTLLLLIGGNILLFGLITFLVQRLRPVRTRISSPDCLQRQLDRIMHFASILLPVWVIGVIGNTIASGGLPLVWLLQGDSARSYVDYGLPTLSGLLNAIGLFLANVVLIEYLMTGVKRHLWVIAAVIALQVLTINRGGLIWAVLEILAVYLLIRKLRLTTLFQAVSGLMLLLLAFGIIGDMRIGEEGRESLQSWMAAPGEAVFGRLPTTAWWVYLYSSVGTVNLNAAVDTVEPVGYPHWSIIGLFPTIIRGMIYDFSVYELKYPLEMVNPVFNVFTLYGGYLADFGLIGCFAVTGFLALVSTWCYQGARSGNLFSLLIYAVMFQVMVLSIFWDNLASHPALFQIMLAFAAQYRWRLWSSTTSRTSHAHS